MIPKLKLKELSNSLTVGELDLMNRVNKSSILAGRVFRSTVNKELYNNGIVGGTKHSGNNKGQFGFYHTDYAGQILTILNRLGLSSICDLGSGPGILLSCLSSFGTELRIKGYEIEKEFVDMAQKLFYGNDIVECKDILSLQAVDVRNYSAIYFWEPLYDSKLAKRFIDNLNIILKKGQYIIYQPSGAIGQYLTKCERFQWVENPNMSSLLVFKVL